MANKNNKTCIVCGKPYRFCTGCSEFDHLPRWMAIFHDSNCKEIFNATSMYEKVPNEEIKARLDKCDLSNKKNFHKNIFKVINELYSSNEETVVIEPENAETVMETVDTVAETSTEEETVQETVKQTKTSRTRKKKQIVM